MKYRKPGDSRLSRKTLCLRNHEKLRKMCGELSYSWFIDELIEREYRRRERKVTQPANNSSLTAQE